MSGPHAYGSDTRNRLKTLGYIALAALFVTIAGLAGIRQLFELPALQSLKPYSWPTSPITMTLSFTGVYLLYDAVLWKKLSKVPNISGTWIGVVLPNYQKDWPHLEILTVDQSWSEMSLQGEVYFRTNKNDSWALDKKLGTYRSVAAGMTDMTADQGHISLCYTHVGKRDGQPDFQGSMYLDYNRQTARLDGKYYTNRIDKVNNKEGSLGRILLCHVSPDVLSPSKALEFGLADDLLAKLEREILNAAT